MDKRQLQRIRVLQAIAKAKKSGKTLSRVSKRFVDTTSKHLPTKKDLQETIVNYIKTNNNEKRI